MLSAAVQNLCVYILLNPGQDRFISYLVCWVNLMNYLGCNLTIPTDKFGVWTSVMQPIKP